MEREYSDFKANVINTVFKIADNRTCNKTALITFYDSKGIEISKRSFGVIDTDALYEMISDGSELFLDNCYISGFSLSDYRLKNGLDRKEPVFIKLFSVRDAFFESEEAIDFSHSVFPDGDVSFEGTHFAKGKVFFTGSVFGKGTLDFNNCLFRNDVEFNGAIFDDGDFFFRNVILKGFKKDFQDMRFGNGEISFANTEFNYGELLFINTNFGSGQFSFKVARITGGRIDFHYSVFHNGEISFERAEFGNSRVDFRAVSFGNGKVNFNRSVFGNGEINFEGSSASAGKFQFKKAEMGSGYKNFSLLDMEDIDMNFERTMFGSGDVTFSESRLKSLSLKSCHLNQYFDLRLAKAEILDISDTIVRDIIDMEPFDFPVQIETLDISGMRLPGKLYISWKQNKCRNCIINQEGTTLGQKAEQFRLLKENFSETGKYEDEDNAYVMFKRYESRSWLTGQQEKGRVNGILSYFPHGFKWLVFDKIGLYATSPGRVLMSVVGFWVIFGFIYFFIELSGFGRTMSSVGNPDAISPLLQSFYHSAITFFTIGYGDVYPMGLSRIISGVEGFIGVFMMSYFTVAFVRKVLR
jgi:hypothetical protein